MSTPIFDAIVLIIKAGEHPTVASIAMCSKRPKPDVIKALADNSVLIKRDRRRRIFAIHKNLTFGAREAAWASGKFFRRQEINYGAATILDFKDGNPAADALKEEYWCGGFGDSYKRMVVMDTPENEKALRALGMKDFSEVVPSEWPGYKEWKE